MRRRHLGSVSAAPYGRCLGIVRIQPQLSGKRVLGRSPKRVLPTFAHTKVGPRRVGVPALHPAKSPPRRQATTNWLRRKREIKLSHSIYRQSLRHGCAVPPPFAQGRLSPPGDRQLGQNSFPAFSPQKGPHSSTFTACPRQNEYSTASVTGRPNCRRTMAAYSFSCRAYRPVSSCGAATRSVL